MLAGPAAGGAITPAFAQGQGNSAEVAIHHRPRYTTGAALGRSAPRDTLTDAHGQQARPAPSPPRGFTELVRAGCEGYVLEGIGLPLAAYLFHAVKLVLFVLGWMFFVSFTPGLGRPWDIGHWWLEGIAFQKAFLWACLVEVLGCGCMSGPLGFHIWPPFTAFLHFLRPGTTKLPPFPDLPVFGGRTR